MRPALGGESFFPGALLLSERISEAAVSAIVGCENDNRVFPKTVAFKRVNDFANKLVSVKRRWCRSYVAFGR